MARLRMIDENILHGTGRRIENASEGITLQIKKKAELPGHLPNYGCPVEHSEWSIRFYHILGKCL